MVRVPDIRGVFPFIAFDRLWSTRLTDGCRPRVDGYVALTAQVATDRGMVQALDARLGYRAAA